MSFEFLIEMAWKSALISGAALALAALLRRRSAGERSALLGTAAALIVSLPLVALLLPALPVVTSTVREAAPAALSAADYAALAAPPAAAAPRLLDDPAPLLEWLWAGGAALLLLRLVAGLATLRRWTRAGSELDCPAWRGALARGLAETGCRRDVRLLVADVPSPLSWGARRPAILVDPDTARDPAEAEAVVAHELAHIARGDWIVLILSRLAVALFWFNPLMWLLERRIQAEAEEAADARALQHVEPARYAQTLLSCAQGHAAARLPASAMADAPLGRRVRAILERRLKVGAPDPRWVRGAMVLAACVAAPIAALKPVQAIVRAAPPAPAAPATPVAAPASAAAPAPVPTAMAPPMVAAAAAAPQAPSATPIPPVPPAAPRAPRPLVGVVDEEEISRSVARAMAATHEAGEEGVRAATAAREVALRESGPVDREAVRAATVAVADAARRAGAESRRALLVAAPGLRSGADGMERAARQMEQEAQRLGSADYRREQIAREAARGKTMTDQQLLDAIPKLHGGAQKLRHGADRLRQKADRMARGEG
ncbi:MAG: M56 family metallopeptidase [Allosphingosinicella sp.]